MAQSRQPSGQTRAPAYLPGDGVGIQVPFGRILAQRTRWQTIFDARDKPMVYRICNAPTRDPDEKANRLIVEADGARKFTLDVGCSLDVMGKKIRVRAGTGGPTPLAEGWYVLVS